MTPSGWEALRAELLAEHDPSEMQLAHRIDKALAGAREALEDLARMGHPMHLKYGLGPTVTNRSWPRTYFQAGANPMARVVADEFELAELGQGWYSTPDKARAAHGIQTQFSGRGGVGNGALPAMVLSSVRNGGR